MVSDNFLTHVTHMYADTVDLEGDSEIHYGSLVLTIAAKVRACGLVHSSGSHLYVA